MISSPINFREKEIRDTTIEFRSSKKESDVLIRCTLRNCDLILEEPCWVSFASCTFKDCTIMAKKECARIWNGSRWINCKFVGEFSMGFGGRNEDCSLPLGPMVVGCDFSQTTLASTMRNAELATIKYPLWPHVTILEPGLHKQELCALKFSPAINGWWFLYSDDSHQSYSSKTFNWDRLVKSYSDTVDFEPYTDEVRSTLSRLPYVIM